MFGQATLKVASSKVAKHEKTCSDNQHTFIPFAFNTFGFLALEVVNLLQRVKRLTHNNVVSSRSMDAVFKRIGFAIYNKCQKKKKLRLTTNYCTC